jgi:sulfur relay (sulfurtransferase) complex TusBCD TusD component (DsrE family)
MQNKKLGILLASPASSLNTERVLSLCEEALHGGIDVFLYLIDQGVESLHDERYRRLSSAGVKFFACAYGCERHGVSTEGLPPSMSLCGLVVLSNIINGCDRFLAFTG